MHALTYRGLYFLSCGVAETIDAARYVYSRHPNQRTDGSNGHGSYLRVKALLARLLVLGFCVDNKVRDPRIGVGMRAFQIVLE